MADLMYFDPNITLKRQVDVRYRNRMLDIYIYNVWNVSAGVSDENCDHGFSAKK